MLLPGLSPLGLKRWITWILMRWNCWRQFRSSETMGPKVRLQNKSERLPDIKQIKKLRRMVCVLITEDISGIAWNQQLQCHFCKMSVMVDIMYQPEWETGIPRELVTRDFWLSEKKCPEEMTIWMVKQITLPHVDGPSTTWEAHYTQHLVINYNVKLYIYIYVFPGGTVAKNNSWGRR